MLDKLLGRDGDPTKLEVAISAAAAVVGVLKAIDKIYRYSTTHQGAS